MFTLFIKYSAHNPENSLHHEDPIKYFTNPNIPVHLQPRNGGRLLVRQRHRRQKIKSPNELCRYYAEQRRKDSYERPGAGGHISLRGIKLKYVSENIRDCNFYYIFISGAQAGSENYGQARLLRKGECSPSESYSHATGTCEKNGGPAGKSPLSLPHATYLTPR